MKLLILETNLMWSSRLANAARALGHEAVVSKDLIEGSFDAAIVNLGTPCEDWPALVQLLKRRGMKVIGHAGHKEKDLHTLGREAGCDILATNSEIANRLDRVLLAASRNKVRVAVTGGVAEGKSTVLGYLMEAGHQILSADAVARDVYESAQVQGWLALAFGQSPTRKEVRSRVAKDDGFRRSLNQLIHPLVLSRLLSSDAAFIEVPLLIEACLQSAFDRVWVVTCGRETQLERLTERFGSSTEALEFMDTQLDTRTKIPFADEVLRTNMAEETVRRIVIEAASRI